MIRELLAMTLDALLGRHCVYGCGQRVYPKDVAAHNHYDHAGLPEQP